MNRVYVNITTHERPGLLRLCAGWLARSVNTLHPPISLAISDDCSQDPKVGECLSRLAKRGVDVRTLKTPKKLSGSQRLGWMRAKAIDRFLKYRSEPFLLLLDDDILVDSSTILAVIEDYSLLQSVGATPGSLTLHGMKTRWAEVKYKDKVFSRLNITGDAHWLMDRGTLQVVGNRLGTQRNGFADPLLLALRGAGRYYYDRTQPPYEVQHLGFGVGGSVIHTRDGRTMEWNRAPYQTHVNHWLTVDGFDVLRYAEYMRLLGTYKAPIKYAEEEGL